MTMPTGILKTKNEDIISVEALVSIRRKAQKRGFSATQPASLLRLDLFAFDDAIKEG